jgi:hypothetical protein
MMEGRTRVRTLQLDDLALFRNLNELRAEFHSKLYIPYESAVFSLNNMAMTYSRIRIGEEALVREADQ